MCILVSGCVSQARPTPTFSSLEPQAKTLCEVMENPQAYAGRRVLMKGDYVEDPHHRTLDDRRCPDWDFRVSESFTVDGDRTAQRLVRQARKKRVTVDIPVIYVGTFTVKPFIIGCSERNCQHYSLEEAQLLAASPR
jgi:hypothetical protein